MCQSRRISIEIKDNGLGMNESFVRDHLGEPWAKQDPFTTGSGLSVHLAYRVIDLMGGHMEISSAPGRGCVVNLEVPVLRRSPLIPLTPVPTTSLDPNVIAPTPPSEPKQRKIALVGFNRSDKKQSGLPELGETLKRQYTQLGCEIVSIPDAELIIANGDVEETETGKLLMEGARTDEIIFLVQPGHEPNPDVLDEAKRYSRNVRRIPKPVTPSVIRQTLGRHRAHVGFPTSPVQRHRDGPRSSISSTPEPSSKEAPTPGTPNLSAPSTVKVVKDEDYFRKRPGLFGGFSQLWKPKGMCPEEAIACLSLGDYFSSRRRGTLHRTPSTGSSGRNSSIGDDSSTPATSHSGLFDLPRDNGFSTPVTPNETEPEPTPEPPRIKVLVVEDNMINRKILVRILSTKLVSTGPCNSYRVPVADAVYSLLISAKHKTALRPSSSSNNSPGLRSVRCIPYMNYRNVLLADFSVLLDINMPRMDGYQACAEMRSIERHDPSRPRSQIIAVTALSSEEEKRHGLVECVGATALGSSTTPTSAVIPI
jgi:CheY-like chemotaxis protein